MTRVITYGTFDLFHEGHRRLLERAKACGDHLIVGVTTESYDDTRGKLNVHDSLVERIRKVTESGLADEVIVEEYEGQKIQDIQRYDIDVFVIGSDWEGKFDYLRDYCEVVYLDRTKGVSSTKLREADGVIRLGVVGAGRIARRLIRESPYVSGVDVETVWTRDPDKCRAFAEAHGLPEGPSASFEELLSRVDAVHIASPHETHVPYARQALEAGVHVLCEKPMALRADEITDLYDLANAKGLVLLEALKTAFAPGFQRMVAIARGGTIGSIRSVDATFTKLIRTGREVDSPVGGAITELASYPLLAITKLLGNDPTEVICRSFKPEGSIVEQFARIDLQYPHAIATAKVGIGVKAEGNLVVAGTRGYLYVPSPWWLTEYFETRFEDPRENRKYYYKYDGDGLRYELAEFVGMIRAGARESFKLPHQESLAIARLIEESRAHPRLFGVGPEAD